MTTKTARAMLILLAMMPDIGAAHAAGAEAPVASEVSPPGDIPDNQAFITYAVPSGYSIKVPEGWARRDDAQSAVFSDKYNHISLVTRDAAAKIDGAYAKSTLVPELEKNGRAVDNVRITTVKLKARKVIKLAYDSNSEPNAVTNKQVREENEKFFFTNKGKLVELTLSAPKGADNADQWKFISSSFRWK